MNERNARSISLTVRPEWAGRKGRVILTHELGISGSMLASLSHIPGAIMRNGERMTLSDRVSEDDVLTIRLVENKRKNEALPVECPVGIVYEDDDVAVFNKPAGMAVHGSANGNGSTLANAAAALWGPETPFRPVHRLDRGTSGLLVAAKNAYCAYRLQCDLHTERFVREYLALTCGSGLPTEGTIDLPIRKDAESPTKRIVSPDGAEAKTAFKVLKSYPESELVELRPTTGRTHQIRVHMASLGHPLIGDRLYGGNDRLERPALHSYRIRFVQPVTKQEIELSCPLPPDIRKLLAQLREEQ